MASSEVIKPFTGDPNEYKGPPATADNFAESALGQEMAAAAMRPAMPVAIGVPTPMRARRPLDGESQRNLDELYLQVRSNPFKPATVINFHPWDLQFPMTEPYVRGITVPKCQPGDMFSWHHIRSWSPEKKQLPFFCRAGRQEFHTVAVTVMVANDPS